MKKLNTLLTILILAFITGCSTGVEPEKEGFEPYRIGDFVMTSPTSARVDYKTHIAAKLYDTTADTIRITSFEDRGFAAGLDSLNNRVEFSYIDSTITTRPTIIVRLNGELWGDTAVRWYDDHIRASFAYNNPCSVDITNFDTQISIQPVLNDSILATYIISVDGLEQVAETIKGC